MTLNEHEINLVRQNLDKSGITIALLKDDLLDHLCCDVETRIDCGDSFDSAMSKAIEELAPRGLRTIEEETILLINNKLISMKKLTYSIGLISSLMMTFGTIASVLHLPGGGNLASGGPGTYGFILFAVLFLPLLVFSKLKSNEHLAPYEKVRLTTGMVSGIITVIAVIFKINHLPGANLMMVSGAAVFGIAFLPALFFGMYKKAVG